MNRLSVFGWKPVPELPSLFPCDWENHLSADNDRAGRLQAQRRFLHLESMRHQRVRNSQRPHIVFDRSYFSTLAYSYAIEKHWCDEIYEDILDSLLGMIAEGRLAVPRLLVVLEAPETIRRQRCDARDSAKDALPGWQSYRKLHQTEAFVQALDHFYRQLSNRTKSLFQSRRYESGQSPEALARLIHHAALKGWDDQPSPSIESLRDALSHPYEWAD